MAQGVGRFGIADLIPGLGSWIQETREGIEAPWREKYRQQAMGLLGQEQEIMNANIMGQAPSQAPGQLGAGQVETQQATGLMQDPDDFYQQMQFGLGLMGTPGYESAGQSYAGNALLHQLGLGERQQAQANWQQDQFRQAAETRAKAEATLAQNQQANARQEKVAYANESGALYDDAQALLKKPREAVALFDNVQTTVRNKGFNGMNVTDDTVMVKTLAKLLLPDEAVMEGDISALSTMTGLSAGIKSLAAKLGMGKPLEDYERQQLYDQLHQLGQQKMQQLQSDRGDFTERAERRGINVNDVLNTQIGADLENLRGNQLQGSGGQRFVPGMTQELNDQLDAQSAQENPGMIDSALQWWENFRR